MNIPLLGRFIKSKPAESKPKAAVTGIWNYPESREIDAKELLFLAESNVWVRAGFRAKVNAIIANGYVLIGDENEKQKVQEWINQREDEFFRFLREASYSLLIFDEVYIEVNSEPVPLVIPPWTIRIQRDEHGQVVKYQQIVTKTIDFKPEEIVHIVGEPLAGKARAYGSSLLITLRKILEAQQFVEMFIRMAFERRGVLSKFIKTTGDETTFERIDAMLRSIRPGESMHIRVEPPADIEIENLSEPFKDLQVLDVLTELRQMIISCIGVPPILLGLEGGTNLETSRNQMNAFMLDVRAYQRLLSAAVTEVFRRRFRVENLKFKFNEWTNPEQEIRMHVMKLQAGIETINEAREALGMPRLEVEFANLPLPAATRLDPFALLDTLESLMAQSRQAIPEKSAFLKTIEYPRWIETLDQIILQFVDPERVDTATIRYVTIDSERGIVLAVADVMGDEFGLMRRPVALMFSRTNFNLESAKRYYNAVFPKWIMKALINEEA